MRVTRKGRNNYAISGEFETFQNWGNENTMHYQLTNSHGMLLYRGSKPFCEAFNWQHPIVMKMRASTTIPPGNYCPMPKGNYVVVDLRLQEEDLPLVAVKDTYTAHVKMTAPDGHMMQAYKVQFSIS
ncbi:uncharacterized protein LOC128739282 [Sabethes cyaneus]|uniref:uncharacterized protein LOC128739282 n=1 Tax=Sabethes cyaneus TaxID=53552 RepID=UPI00237DFEA1|nr:uncharacterized protein LOC128739282 [Sabethes cyaneus]